MLLVYGSNILKYWHLIYIILNKKYQKYKDELIVLDCLY
jgi:hypothetical protein